MHFQRQRRVAVEQDILVSKSRDVPTLSIMNARCYPTINRTLRFAVEMGQLEKNRPCLHSSDKKARPRQTGPRFDGGLAKTGILLLVVFVIFGVAFAAAADFGIDIHSE
jgi:hypothetical protein